MELIVAVIIGLLIFLAQTILYRNHWDRELEVEVLFDDKYVRAGEKSSLTECVANRKALPLPVFHIKFSCSKSFVFDNMDNSYVTDSNHRNEVYSVLGHQRVTRRLFFTAQKRGYYELSFVHLLTRDFFLTHKFAKKIENDSHLLVLPKRRTEKQVQIAFQSMYGEFLNRSSLLEDPYLFRGIRDYVPTDHERYINWKATARTGDLKVNVYDPASDRKVRILLNLETNTMIHYEELREIAIELCGTMFEWFVRKKVPVSFASNGVDVVSGECAGLASGCSGNHVLAMDQCLARISENAGLLKFQQIVSEEIARADKTTEYIIISPYYKEDLMKMLDQLQRTTGAVSMLCPYFDIQQYERVRPYIHDVEIKLEKA